MVNCAVYRFLFFELLIKNITLHGENMKRSDVHIPRVLEVNVRVKRMSGVRGGGEQ